MDTHPAGEFHPVILFMGDHSVIRAASAIPERGLASHSVHLPGAEVWDLTVAVWGAGVSREEEAEALREEVAGVFLVEVVEGIDKILKLFGFDMKIQEYLFFRNTAVEEG